MTPLSMLYVMLGGAMGSLCRYVLHNWITRFFPLQFPLGTFIINVAGGFLMGVWIAALAHALPARAKDFHLLFAVGVLGGFTTFSTFSLDVYYLMQRGETVQAGLYAVGSVILSVTALAGGMWLVRTVF